MVASACSIRRARDALAKTMDECCHNGVLVLPDQQAIERSQNMATQDRGHARENTTSVLDDTAQPFTSCGQVDVSGLSHPGKVRPRNEDHFIVNRIGRYLETV